MRRPEIIAAGGVTVKATENVVAAAIPGQQIAIFANTAADQNEPNEILPRRRRL